MSLETLLDIEALAKVGEQSARETDLKAAELAVMFKQIRHIAAKEFNKQDRRQLKQR